jgi:hypothetical protein
LAHSSERSATMVVSFVLPSRRTELGGDCAIISQNITTFRFVNM